MRLSCSSPFLASITWISRGFVRPIRRQNNRHVSSRRRYLIYEIGSPSGAWRLRIRVIQRMGFEFKQNLEMIRS